MKTTLANHFFHLHNDPFTKIKNGTKTVELRLYDDKRKLIKIGDNIIFESRSNNEVILKHVSDLKIFKNFVDAYNNYDKISIGYDAQSTPNAADMQAYYSDDEVEKYGVLAIELKR